MFTKWTNRISYPMKGWSKQRLLRTATCIVILNFYIFHVVSIGMSSENVVNLHLEDPDHDKVAIIGGAGYLGSYLSMTLQENGFKVTIFDKDPKLNNDIFGNSEAVTVIKAHSRSLTSADLAQFGSVVFLGGCTLLVQELRKLLSG